MNKELREFDRSSKLLDLLALSPSEQAKLTERVRANRGWVEVWVHTHFNESGLVHFKIGAKYAQLRDRMISSLATEERPPVIALIPLDQDNTQDYEKLYKVEALAQPIYTVETLPQNPVPNLFQLDTLRAANRTFSKELYLISDQDIANVLPLLIGLSESDKQALLRDLQGNKRSQKLWEMKHFLIDENELRLDKAWKTFFEQFALLGVKGVIVMGRNYITEYWPGANNSYIDKVTKGTVEAAVIPNGCVGTFIKKAVDAGVRVEMTNVTFPKRMSKYGIEILRNAKY